MDTTDISVLSKYKHFFFIGIAGTGMSAVAQYVKAIGKKVSGSDRLFNHVQSLLIREQFEKMGVECFPQDASGIHRDVDCVVISTAIENSSIDMMMGIGGAKEAVIAAAGLKCLDGEMQARVFYNDYFEKTVAANLGMGNPDKIYKTRDLAQGDDILIAITGVTDGVLLPGVKYFSGGAKTHSIVIRQKTHTIRFIDAVHRFDYKPIF